MPSTLRLRNGVLRASQIDSSLWIVEVGDLPVIIDIDWNISKCVRATEFAVFSFNIHIQLEAGSAEEFEALYPGQSVTIESEQGETELDDDILHGKITC